MAKEKIRTADDEAAEYLALQLSKSRESRFENMLVTVLTMCFVFFFAVFFWILPDKDFSEEENTTLQTMPEFTVDGFLHGGYTQDFGTYMADQFPCRNFFVGLKALTETAQLKGQNNGVIIADDGYLVARTDYPDEQKLENNLSSAGKFISVAEQNGIDCTVAFAGRKMDVLQDELPTLYGSYYSDRIFGILDDSCKEKDIEYIDLRAALLATGEKNLYYKTDHHWTSLGAYYAYTEIAKEMGFEPYSLSDYEVETVTDEFYGTTWSTAGVKWTEGDTIEYFRWNGDENVTMKIESPRYEYKDCTETVENGIDYKVFNSFYVREMLEGKDKYASFLGGNNNSMVYLTMAQNDGAPVEERETVVLLRDSFADSLAPFLARHFDIILIDLRTASPDTIGLCIEKGINDIIFVYNMETLTTSNDLGKLNMGLSNYRK